MRRYKSAGVVRAKTNKQRQLLQVHHVILGGQLSERFAGLGPRAQPGAGRGRAQLRDAAALYGQLPLLVQRARALSGSRMH